MDQKDYDDTKEEPDTNQSLQFKLNAINEKVKYLSELRESFK